MRAMRTNCVTAGMRYRHASLTIRAKLSRTRTRSSPNCCKSLARNFSEARTNLEGQWDRGDDVSTEELRLTLQRYRSFFERLLTV